MMSDIEIAKACAYALRVLTVTDPSNQVAGANANASHHKTSHSGLMSAIQNRAGSAQSAEEKSQPSQLALGARTLNMGQGVCTHLAAAVAHRLIALGMSRKKIEIATTNKGHGYGHTFNTVNRIGDINNMKTWGKDCIIIDIWMANQNHTSDSVTVDKATANFGQGAFYLRDNPGYEQYLNQFGKKMGVVTRFS